jgi:hypothetical protein
VLEFWRNPEFIRHARAELRPPRAITAGLLALVICALVALACWSSMKNDLNDLFKVLHGWLLGIQFTVLSFWCASTCGQAISRERELKTYDFLKTTRLTSAELMIGKVLGAPIMGYFVVGCSLPISVLAGLLGGYGLGTLLFAYALLLVSSLFLSLLGLWISMLTEKSSLAAAALLALFPVSLSFGFAYSRFPGFGALSIFPAVFTLYKVNAEMLRVKPTLFGMTTSFGALTLLLYAAFGAWLVLMLVRNLKKGREQIRLLSRWQAVGFAAFLNVLFYAFLDPNLLTGKGHNTARPEEIATLLVALNGSILFLVGLATLTPHEQLKAWWRRRRAREEGYFSESGLPWPWLVASALVAYGLLLAEALGLRSAITLDRWHLGTAAIQLTVLLVFTARDILFLQWCALTAMKRPLVKGFLYLCLYYIAVTIFSGVASAYHSSAGVFIMQLLTPWGAFIGQDRALTAQAGVWVGIGLQLLLIVMVLKVVTLRLERPATIRAEVAAA